MHTEPDTGSRTQSAAGCSAPSAPSPHGTGFPPARIARLVMLCLFAALLGLGLAMGFSLSQHQRSGTISGVLFASVAIIFGVITAGLPAAMLAWLPSYVIYRVTGRSALCAYVTACVVLSSILGLLVSGALSAPIDRVEEARVPEAVMSWLGMQWQAAPGATPLPGELQYTTVPTVP